MGVANQAVRSLQNAVVPFLTTNQRIILDEIHTIGRYEGGTAWEQIILLAPCPIMSVAHRILGSV